MMHKAGKLEEKKKISSVVVALRDAITFLRQLPISSAAKSMYNPVWSCMLLMTDHDTSLILLLGALYSFESTLNITGKNLIPLTSSSFCSGDKKKSKVALGKLSQLSSTEMQMLYLQAWGLGLLSSRIRCKILKTRIWGKSFTLSLQADRELWFHLHFHTSLALGAKPAVLGGAAQITPRPSCKALQPAALLVLSEVSWKATAHQKITAASCGAAGDLFLNRIVK